jgi:hypothetical protein
MNYRTERDTHRRAPRPDPACAGDHFLQYDLPLIEPFGARLHLDASASLLAYIIGKE